MATAHDLWEATPADRRRGKCLMEREAGHEGRRAHITGYSSRGSLPSSPSPVKDSRETVSTAAVSVMVEDCKQPGGHRTAPEQTQSELRLAKPGQLPEL